jgi:hypothetical protein
MNTPDISSKAVFTATRKRRIQKALLKQIVEADSAFMAER